MNGMLTPPGAYGPYTQTPLGDASPLLAAPQEDAWGYMRAPYSPRLMRLCMELSAATYTFDLARFFQSGWMDATLQVENRLFSHVDSGYAHKTPREFIRSGVRLRRAQSLLAPAFTDVLRAMRQLVTTDTGKAVVMALPLGENRFAIAVSFMGTGRKFYDWFTNFKLSCRAGVHEGFDHTARLLDRSSERIAFPRTAQLLGRHSLTLADVLSECTQRDSRFRLFLCGHSQGGAVAQAYCHLLRTQRGVLTENIVGYTLGSPSIANADFPDNPAEYPFYHLINDDDFVPRMGACMRLGVEMRFSPDPDFRMRCYRYTGSESAARIRLRTLTQDVRAMPDVLEMMTGALRAVMRLPDPAETRIVLSAFSAQMRLLAPAMQSLGLHAQDLALLIDRQLLSAFRALTQRLPDEKRLSYWEECVTAFIHDFGARLFSRCVWDVGVAPHMLMNTRARDFAPYQLIAARFPTALRPLLCTRDENRDPYLLAPPGAWYASPDAPVLPDARAQNAENS